MTNPHLQAKTMQRLRFAACCALLWASVGAGHAETPALTNEASATPTPTAQPAPERLVSDGLPYADGGVAMAPLRPICDFLKATTTYQDGLISVAKTFEGGAARTVTLRLGGKGAQVWDGAAPRAVGLARPAESRLGVIFLPAKFLVEILGGQLEVNASGVANRLLDGNRQGIFAENEKYSGADAARVTLTNRVGKAMSLRLNGPQKMRVEVGQGGTIYLQVKPGVYYFQACSAGMQTINGARRFLAGRKTTWAWGRQK